MGIGSFCGAGRSEAATLGNLRPVGSMVRGPPDGDLAAMEGMGMLA